MAKSNGELLDKMTAEAPKAKTLEAQIRDVLTRPEVLAEMKKLGEKTLAPERLARIVLTCIRQQPELAKCSLPSLLVCLLLAQQFGLEPGTGQCYLIPRGGQCTFMIGYQGYIEIIARAHPGSTIEAHPLYSNDKFVARRGYEGDKSLNIFLHEEAFPDRGELIGYYAYFRPAKGQPKYERMTLAEVNAIATASGNRNVWSKHPVEMGRKTLVRRLQKFIPKTETILDADEHLGLELSQEAETVTLNVGEKAASRPVAAIDAPHTTIDATFHENEAQPTLGLSDSEMMALELEQ